MMRTPSLNHLTLKGKRPLDPGGVLLDDTAARGLLDFC